MNKVDEISELNRKLEFYNNLSGFLLLVIMMGLMTTIFFFKLSA